MRTREQMIAVLTHDEMQFLVENPDKHNVTEITDFFAKGGFNIYSDEQLNEVYDLKYGEGVPDELA
jgi:hypothetical protein